MEQPTSPRPPTATQPEGDAVKSAGAGAERADRPRTKTVGHYLLGRVEEEPVVPCADPAPVAITAGGCAHVLY